MNEDLILNIRNISTIIEELQQDKTKLELSEASCFNPFKFINADEMGLSKILAFLLNPKESHGQQDLFLISFLKYLGLSNFFDYEYVRVYTEKTTFQDRRHDIFIEGFLHNQNVWAISIENKLAGAGDQDKQVAHYLEDLAKKSENYHLVYLTINGDNPTKDSISKEKWEEYISKKQCRSLSAGDILKWLEQTQIIAKTVNQFCQYFIQYINEDIMGNSPHSDELVEKLLKIENRDLLFSTLTIIKSGEHLYEKLLSILNEQINNIFINNYPKLVKNGWKFELDYNLSKKTLCPWFCKNSEWGVCLECSENFSRCYYGIYAHKNDINNKDYKILTELFKDYLSEMDFRYSRFYLGWKFISGELSSWSENVWMQVPTGELADKLMTLFDPLLRKVEKHINQVKDI